jgi:Icc protein
MGETAPAELRVLQLTDTHLLAEESDTLRGRNTDDTLRAVLKHIRQYAMPADMLLATGDLVHDGPASAYLRLKSYLLSLDIPVHCLPGNHDDPATMAAALAHDQITCMETIDHNHWRIILLNSVVPGQDKGELSTKELERLNHALSDVPGRHALVCLHHHPVPMGCSGMDRIGIVNAESFFEVIDHYPCVRGVLWGHVHNEFVGLRKGVRLLATPSTCFQFKLDAAEITIDDAPPAYRWLRLSAEGRIETGIVRVRLPSSDG